MTLPPIRHAVAVPGASNRAPWIVWLLMLIQCIGAAHASFNIDTARDLAFALDIADGSRLHLSGPEIGSSFRLGPLWYYLLAVPFALGLPVGAIAWITAATSSLQYWLAWRLGLAVRDRRLGLCLALALALPAWTRMYWLASAHTILTVPAVLAALLAWTTYWTRPSAPMAFLGGLGIGVALHGHPSALPLVALLSVPLFRRDHGRRALALLAGVLGCAVLFIPAAIEQAMSGWSDLTRTTQYLSAQDWMANLRHLPRVLWGIVVLGAPAAAEISLSPYPALKAIATAIAWTGLLTGAIGVAWSWRVPRLRACIAVAMTLAVLNLAIVASARDYVTYYSVDLATTLIALMAGAGWYGLAALRPRTPFAERWLATAAVAAMLLLNAGLLAGWMAQVRAGRVTAPIDAGLNLQKRTPQAPSVIAPAVFFKDLAYFERQVCAEPQPVVHGDGALFLDLMGEVLRRSGCARATSVQLGGRSRPGAPDLAAIPCEILHDTSAHPLKVQGDLCWLPVSRNLNTNSGAAAANSRIYLPHVREAGGGSLVFEDVVAGGDIVVLAVTRPDWVEFTAPAMTVGGMAIAPFYANGHTFAWSISGPPAVQAPFVITMTAANPDAVDVFALSPH